MQVGNFIKKLRRLVGDMTEPYTFSDKKIENYINDSVYLYSRCRPRKKIGCIDVYPNVCEYRLPKDYQTWISGFEDYTVVDRNVLVGNRNLNYKIEFLYYADRNFDEIPVRDISLILEYCISEMIEWDVISTISSDWEDNENVVAINLGKGLNIAFEDTKTLKKELRFIAKSKKEHFFAEINNTLRGGWC